MPRSHASLPRLFIDSALAGGDLITLGREQSNYLAAVLRMGVGSEAVLFNGRDGAWRAGITAAGKRVVSLELLEQIAPQTPPSDLWYGFAPLKSARLDYVVQKATEMGVGAMQPVLTRFTQMSRIRMDKLRANVVEAAEQCEVLSVPEVQPEIALADLVATWPAAHRDRVLLVADESLAASSPLDVVAGLSCRRIGLLIGPEGGFSDSERELLSAQPFARTISLGPRILRADTAAVAALAVIQASIGDWR